MQQSAASPAATRADHLLFAQYRCWMAGFATGDAACWGLAWDRLVEDLPVAEAKTLYGEFHHFVRTLRDSARRAIDWRPAVCSRPCRDECLVLALVAASQRGDSADERRHAGALADPADLQNLVAASRSLARALMARGLALPQAECPVRAGLCGAV